MHYTSGLGAFTSFAAVGQLPEGTALWTLAHLLLSITGALFVLYLVLALNVCLAGVVLRLRDRSHRTVRGRHVGVPRAGAQR